MEIAPGKNTPPTSFFYFFLEANFENDWSTYSFHAPPSSPTKNKSLENDQILRINKPYWEGKKRVLNYSICRV